MLNELNDFKKAIVKEVKAIHAQLLTLEQRSPTFIADKQAIVNDLQKLFGYEPKEDESKAENEGETHDAHPEVVKPVTEKTEDRPENTDTTPQEQKDAQVTPPQPVVAPVS